VAKRTDVAKPIDRASRERIPRPRARKRFGQHFLEAAWVTKLIESLSASSGDTFLEIGPGTGALTIPLAQRAGRVVAVEIDRDLADALHARVPAHVRIVSGDFLALNLSTLLAEEASPVRVVGNLPYNVSSPILFALIGASKGGAAISDATLMLQKEVADRLAARPGAREYGALAIQAALTADIERVLVLPPGAFRPPPKVWSAVVRLRFRQPTFDAGSAETFERVVRGVFLQRRKTLANALKPVAHALGVDATDLIEKAGLDGSRRPETLTPAEFGRLARAVL